MAEADRVTAEEYFAARLKALRVTESMSQAKLSRMVTSAVGYAVDSTAITRVEKGERLIRLGEAAAIAEALGVPLASMLPAVPRLAEGDADLTLTKAAEAAPRALGEFVGDAVAVVLLDRSMDEFPDPNVHELAYVVLMMARLGAG